MPIEMPDYAREHFERVIRDATPWAGRSDWTPEYNKATIRMWQKVDRLAKWSREEGIDVCVGCNGYGRVRFGAAPSKIYKGGDAWWRGRRRIAEGPESAADWVREGNPCPYCAKGDRVQRLETMRAAMGMLVIGWIGGSNSTHDRNPVQLVLYAVKVVRSGKNKGKRTWRKVRVLNGNATSLWAGTGDGAVCRASNGIYPVMRERHNGSMIARLGHGRPAHGDVSQMMVWHAGEGWRGLA